MISVDNWLGLKSKRVLIAGAGGLGVACAVAFLEVGASVVLVDRSSEALGSISKQVDGYGSLFAGSIVGDVSTSEGAEVVVSRAVEILGGIDVFLHAIGINHRIPVLDISDDQWHQTIRTNLDSAFFMGRSIGSVMVSQIRSGASSTGRMVFISSVSSLLAHPNHAPYAATKGAINQLVRVMAREWAPLGIGVNAIAPGYVQTPLTFDYLERDGHRQQLEGLVPMGRLSTPDEVTGSILFLSSERSSFVTGHILYVDGGRTLV